MAQEREIVDITQSPDLMRVAEEVRRSKTPRVLRAGDEDVAVVMPVAAQPQRRVQRVKKKRITRHSSQAPAPGVMWMSKGSGTISDSAEIQVIVHLLSYELPYRHRLCDRFPGWSS